MGKGASLGEEAVLQTQGGRVKSLPGFGG